MSHWETLSSDDRQQELSRIASMVRNRKMPLSQYLLIHRDAKLSDAEVGCDLQLGARSGNACQQPTTRRLRRHRRSSPALGLIDL